MRGRLLQLAAQLQTCTYYDRRAGDSNRQRFAILLGLMPRRSSPPQIVRRRSRLHGLGVFALEPITKNTRIIDYDGELIDHKESFKRETKYLKNNCIWCFTVNRRWVRDANVDGNIARFIN